MISSTFIERKVVQLIVLSHFPFILTVLENLLEFPLIHR